MSVNDVRQSPPQSPNVTSGSAILGSYSNGVDAVAPFATLQALPRQQGKLYYGTDTDKLYTDDGSTLSEISPVGGSGYSHPNHSGEVTSIGDGAQTVDKTAISNKSNVTAASSDEILIGDADDAGNLKKVTAQSIADLNTGGYTHPNHTGDVTSLGDGVQTIAPDAVTNAKSANMPANTMKGNDGVGAANPQDLSTTEVRALINVEDGANDYSHPNHTGDVTSSGDGAQTIASNAVSNSKAATMPANTIKGNDTLSPANQNDLTATEVRSLINVADGANNYAHPNHTGDVTSSGDGAQTIAANAVSNAKAATMSANTLKGNDTGGAANQKDLTPSEARTLLNVADGANNYAHPNHTGEVTSTGDGSQALGSTAITNKAAATVAADDKVLISDLDDSGNLKQVTAQSIADLFIPIYSLNFSFGSDSKPYLKGKLASYEVLSMFHFPGSDQFGTPDTIKINFTNKGGITSDVRIYDVTNALVIAESTGLDPVTEEVFEEVELTSTPANVSTGEAVWEVQLLVSATGGGKETWVSSLWVNSTGGAGGSGGGGSSDPSAWMDRAAFSDDSEYVNLTDDFTTDPDAVPIDVIHTPANSGTYLITLNLIWSVDTGTFDFLGELLVDDGAVSTATTIRKYFRAEPADAAGAGGSSGTDQRFSATLRYLHTSTASTDFNVIFRHRATDPAIESTVKSSMLTIERWS